MRTARFAPDGFLLRFAAAWLLFAAFTIWMTAGAHARDDVVPGQDAKPEAVMAPNPATLQWQSLPSTVHEADWPPRNWGRRNTRKRFGRKTPGRTYRAKPDRRDVRSRGLFGPTRGRASRFDRRTSPYAERRARRPGRGYRSYRLRIFGGRLDPGLPYRSYRPQPAGSYSTVCVRLCDGYFFPITHAASQSRFMADHAVCQNSCKAPSKLFVHATGTDIDQAYDLMGKRYTSLPNAFLYRKEYVSNCQCRADPWTKEAKAVHEHYAAVAKDPSKAKPVVASATPTPYGRVGSAQPRPHVLGWSSNRVIKYRRGRERAKRYRARRPSVVSPRVPFWSW